MAVPLTKEIREKIITHKKNGEKDADIAKWLMITPRSVTRIWSLYKTQKSIEPKPHKKGRKPAFCESVMKKITAKVKEQPDITLDELVEHFKLNISISALSRKLTKLDLSFKKRRYFVKNSSARMSNGLGVSG